jgi:NAD(P)H-dependent FMN reductase
MNRGIIVHSQTEHTFSVAEKLKERLMDLGNEANVERVVTDGEAHPGAKNIRFKELPDVKGYDGLIFGAPVHAFSLSPAMKAYLEQITTLQDKKIACFVTKGMRFKWTGGTRAIGQMKNICRSKGGNVIETGIVIWNKSRDEQISDLIDKVSLVF